MRVFLLLTGLVANSLAFSAVPAFSTNTYHQTHLSVHTMSVPMGMDGNTRVTIPFDAATANGLGDEVNKLLASFKAIKAGSVPTEDGIPIARKQEVLEYKASTGENVELVIECNPNIFPDPFKAEVFVKVTSGDLVISSQCMLPKLIEAIKTFKAEQ